MFNVLKNTLFHMLWIIAGPRQVCSDWSSPTSLRLQDLKEVLTDFLKSVLNVHFLGVSHITLLVFPHNLSQWPLLQLTNHAVWMSLPCNLGGCSTWKVINDVALGTSIQLNFYFPIPFSLGEFWETKVLDQVYKIMGWFQISPLTMLHVCLRK